MGEEKKTGTKTTVAAVAGWIMSAILLAVTLLKGGTADITVPCMNGGECLVVIEVAEGILNLADDCKFKEVSDSCRASIAATAVYTKKGNPVVEEEVTPEPAPEPEKEAADAPTEAVEVTETVEEGEKQ